VCADCGDVIPSSDIASQPRRCYCRSCERMRVNGWRLNNLTKARLHAFQSKLRKYGITLEKFEELSREQGGVCAVCGTADAGENRMFDIDHDHLHCSGGRSCGECVRGLVCRSCNMFMGIAKDNPTSLRKAADYIEKFRLNNSGLFEVPR
jgi:hypothetical protein